jgi:hypothetical protein
MRKLGLGIGTTVLLTAAAAAPAMAQVGFYAGPFGVGVGVGAPAYYDCGYTVIRAATTTTMAAPTSWLAPALVVGMATAGMAATFTSTTDNH